MNPRLSRRTGVTLGSTIGAAALAAGLLVAPTAAVATPAAAPLAAQNDAGGACEVTGGTLTWGLKESFRSYISGSIANGSWDTSDGADYEIPNFIWSDPVGEFDPETGTGQVSFTGTVHFTGHDGVLDLTLANPTIEFEGDGTAALLMDASSTDMEGEVAVDETQVWVGAITTPDTIAVTDDAIDLPDMPTKLTNSGAGAFAGFYEADSDLDPITLELQFDGCEGGPVALDEDALIVADEDEGSRGGEPEQAELAQTSVPWLPISIGGVALLVIGLTIGLLIGGRKKAPDTYGQANQAGQPGQPE